MQKDVEIPEMNIPNNNLGFNLKNNPKKIILISGIIIALIIIAAAIYFIWFNDNETIVPAVPINQTYNSSLNNSYNQTTNPPDFQINYTNVSNKNITGGGSSSSSGSGSTSSSSSSSGGPTCTDNCSTLGYQCGENIICSSSVNCGYCSSGFNCSNSVCVNQSCIAYNFTYNFSCYNNDVYWFDNCGGIQNITQDCNYGCENNTCLPYTCSPNCQGKNCGDDGCGGVCGYCGSGEYCNNYICEIASCTKYVSTTGSAVWADCSSEANPCNLTYAEKNAVAGDVVCLRAGVYTAPLKEADSGALQPSNSGTVGNLITFKAYPGEGCQGEYGKAKTNCKVILESAETGAHYGIWIYPRDYIKIEGFEIRNFSAEGIYIQHSSYNLHGKGIQIKNNYLHNITNNPDPLKTNNKAILAANVNDCLIENNEITLSAWPLGIGGKSGGNILIKGNYIHDNYQDGITVSGENITIEYNTISNKIVYPTHPDAIQTGALKNVKIRYNKFSDFTQLVYLAPQNSRDEVTGGEILEDIEIYGNVLYNHNYKLKEGSLPGISLSPQSNLSNAGVAYRNISIFSNTFGFVSDEGVAPIQYTPRYGNATYNFNNDTTENIMIFDNIFYRKGILIEAKNGSSNSVNYLPLNALDSAQIYSDYNMYYLNPSPWNNEGTHSITGQNPLFANYQTPMENASFDSWDFSLQSSSPAIDTGTNVEISEDIEGNPRPVDGDDSGTAEYDIGAYEYQEGQAQSTSFFSTIMNFFKSLLTGNTIKEITGNFFKIF